MKLLLDTHVFIWWAGEPERLSAQAFALCANPANELLLSVASIWEMQIKHHLGKLNLPLPLHELIASQQRVNDLGILSIELAHVLALQHLPDPHRDPFDQLLVAQARVESVTILSMDKVFAAYPIDVLG